MTNQELPHEHEQPDEWHRHGSGEGAAQSEHGAHASARALTITFIAMVLGVAFVIIVLVAYFNAYTSRFTRQVQETTVLGQPVREQRAADLGKRDSYGWVDPQTVKIPIDRAMEKVIEEKGIPAG